MRYSKVMCLAVILGPALILGLPSASAEIVQVKSKITDINPSSDYINVVHLDPRTEKTEEIKIDLEPNTHFEDGKSLKDLKIGDDISIEANYNAFTHEWKAQSIGPYSKSQ